MGMLDGKVALVTGAGGGLGRAHALLLAKEGAAVVVNDLGGSRDGTGAGHSMADGVVDEIKAAGGKAVAHYGSVTEKKDAQGMVETAIKTFGKLDILIANAGILRDKSFKNMDDDMWDIVINVHLRGTYLTTKAAFDHMLERGEGGRIIMTSSTSGLLGNFGQTNYGAAKAGIAGFARCLWLEGLKYGITVNVLAPTAMSRMTEDILPEGVQDKSFKNMDDDMWDIVINVHLRGTYLTTKAAFDHMLARGEGGRIIMTSSTSGLLGNFGQTNYGAAKAGIAGFARCLWLEGLKYGITVNVLAPTAMSRMTEDILPEGVQDKFPPENVSPPIVWLCTDEAKDITGRQWLVAGNTVNLLSWQMTPIAARDLESGPWDVAEIGKKILASKESWPPINPMRG